MSAGSRPGIIREQVARITGRYETSNPFELAVGLEITVVNFGFPDSIGGLYIGLREDEDYILVNRSLELREKKVVVGHELGHSVLQHETRFCIYNELIYEVRMSEEREANLFCAELLIPDSIVSEKGYEDPEALSSELEIPRELAELKLSSLHGD